MFEFCSTGPGSGTAVSPRQEGAKKGDQEKIGEGIRATILRARAQKKKKKPSGFCSAHEDGKGRDSRATGRKRGT